MEKPPRYPRYCRRRAEELARFGRPPVRYFLERKGGAYGPFPSFYEAFQHGLLLFFPSTDFLVRKEN